VKYADDKPTIQFQYKNVVKVVRLLQIILSQENYKIDLIALEPKLGIFQILHNLEICDMYLPFRIFKLLISRSTDGLGELGCEYKKCISLQNFDAKTHWM
jgi:hypothetical protein